MPAGCRQDRQVADFSKDLPQRKPDILPMDKIKVSATGAKEEAQEEKNLQNKANTEAEENLKAEKKAAAVEAIKQPAIARKSLEEMQKKPEDAKEKAATASKEAHDRARSRSRSAKTRTLQKERKEKEAADRTATKQQTKENEKT